MARLLYSLLFYLAQPLVWLRLLLRGRFVDVENGDARTLRREEFGGGEADP